MKKIIYKDIADDKENLLCILDYMILIYKSHNKHTQVIECQQWVKMLNRHPIQTEYTSEAILALKNILNDCANIYLSYGNIEIGTMSMNLMNKIIKLFKENEKD